MKLTLRIRRIAWVCAVLLLSLCQTNTFAKEDSFLEFGVGVEYGGIGTQVHFPIGGKVFDVYGSVGVFSFSGQTNQQFGAGVGMNFYLDNNNSINLYSGVLNSHSELTENLEHNVDANIGLSFGYKYHFHKIKKSGWSLGVTYNVYQGGHYPFFSIGYRY